MEKQISIHFKYKDIDGFKVKGWKKDILASTIHKKVDILLHNRLC